MLYDEYIWVCKYEVLCINGICDARAELCAPANDGYVRGELKLLGRRIEL
jgi:hypothetical protein